ncbi:MAG: TetR/AcrR family transcriptional regulator [Microbacterium sp.]|uniref:TetR/AcrR family transcriptional regulator n=1 Tax=Microbacterium sp. TaxID=51671 RepID=UPI001AC652C7|nr:TetR/AcrR family transcriptional regulator [Microbacterium sp.]MBN9153219.1 TetR/AcrR family transcriptional regulator [Microbacterium sp.]
MKSSRRYSMATRSAQAERTRQRIVDATIGLALTRPLAQCTLAAIAERADVSVQTILRAFGTRDALFDAAVAAARDDVITERAAHIADVDESLASIVDHYERMGDGMLLLLGQEQVEPLAAEITHAGKVVHRQWVKQLFGQELARVAASERDEAIDILMAATDIYAWKLWRRDAGRTVEETVHRFRVLVAAVVGRLTMGEE